MDRDTQKAYNWAYLAIGHVTRARWLFLRALDRSKPLTNLVRPMRALGGRVGLAAAQFGAIANRLEAPVIFSATEAVTVAAREIMSAAQAAEEGDRTAASQLWISGLDRLERVRVLLDQDSPVSFHYWFINPWRQFPRPIKQALPPGNSNSSLES